ncbi:hypothetical protein PIB30_084599 [Stylosanthes scabra]|uniref:Uncharacterized protein n=1 Tax=Stylosanthes scabra TaxID=79078 RepID=A0ABU6STN1_9FABA|nr:hypothetical protein [Stylosanthes scabra]
MGCQISIFEVRRCAFGDKPYGVAGSYSREGVDVEVNSARSPEIGLWDSRSNRMSRGKRECTLRGDAPCLYSCGIRPQGWSVTLPPLGSLRPLGRACELWTFLVPASYLPVATCLFETQVLREDVFFFFADVSEDNNDFSLAFPGGAVFEISKKSCQNIRVPRVLSVAERELYDWVDEEIFTQPSVIEVDALPELLYEMRLTADREAEGDYVLEAAGPSDRLPFRA